MEKITCSIMSLAKKKALDVRHYARFVYSLSGRCPAIHTHYQIIEQCCLAIHMVVSYLLA